MNPRTTLPFYSETALEVLKNAPAPMTWQEVTAKVPGSCGETISRALRRMRSKGLVCSIKNGSILLWMPTNKTNPAPTTAIRDFKGSSGKAIAMCIPANKPTLVTATIQAIEFFKSQKVTFSAHDVTKKLREMVKDGLAHVDDTECGTVFAYGKKVPKIEHEDIRQIVREYFASGSMSDYNREMDGDHWKYIPDAAQTVPTPPAVTPAPMPASAPDYDGDPTL